MTAQAAAPRQVKKKVDWAALRADFPAAGGHDDGRFDAGLAARLDHAGHILNGDGNDGQVRGSRRRGDHRVGGGPVNLGIIPVDGINGPGETGL